MVGMKFGAVIGLAAAGAVCGGLYYRSSNHGWLRAAGAVNRYGVRYRVIPKIALILRLAEIRAMSGLVA